MDPAPWEKHVDEVVHGDATMEPSVSLLGGYFAFDPINASILVDLLPRMLHIRASDPAIVSVAPIVEFIRRETREKRAGQALVLTRLIEVMMVEALRSAPADLRTTGLLAGLRDPQHILGNRNPPQAALVRLCDLITVYGILLFIRRVV